jgi:hypothetical protein
VAVAVNSNEEPATLSLGGGTGGGLVHAVGRARDAAAGEGIVVGSASGADGGLAVTLPPRSGAIITIS